MHVAFKKAPCHGDATDTVYTHKAKMAVGMPNHGPSFSTIFFTIHSMQYKNFKFSYDITSCTPSCFAHFSLYEAHERLHATSLSWKALNLSKLGYICTRFKTRIRVPWGCSSSETNRCTHREGRGESSKFFSFTKRKVRFWITTLFVVQLVCLTTHRYVESIIRSRDLAQLSH